MPTNRGEDKCALPRCTCAVPAGQHYCCDECKRAHENPDERDEQCPCEHAECTSDGPSGGVTL